MLALGAAVAAVTPAGTTIHLSGDLAAGKTVFARGFLRGLGYHGTVKSPTFTLVESYMLAGRTIHHFDLYRLARADELYHLGFDDYPTPQAICLIEWPEHGAGYLPVPDLALRLDITSATERRAALRAGTSEGDRMLARLRDKGEISIE